MGTHSRPQMGDRPQELINKQLVGHCDLLIGSFWTRLGTPTGRAESGTAEIDLLGELQQAELPARSPSQLTSTREKQKEAIIRLRDDFSAFIRRLTAEWITERDSDPIATDDGKYILGRAQADVLNFRSMITRDNAGFSAALDQILKDLRKLQRHQLFMDGGASWNEFWREGDRVIKTLSEVPDRLTQISGEYLNETEGIGK